MGCKARTPWLILKSVVSTMKEVDLRPLVSPSAQTKAQVPLALAKRVRIRDDLQPIGLSKNFIAFVVSSEIRFWSSGDTKAGQSDPGSRSGPLTGRPWP